MTMDILSFVADDRNLITYRPAWNAFTGSVNATILLQQVIFYWQNHGQKPFYKFKEPCGHKLYRTGDSWTEKLGMTAKEFDTALGKLKAKGFVSSNIDISRVTNYVLHEDVVKQMLESAYAAKNSYTQKGVYVNPDDEQTHTQKGVYENDDCSVINPTNVGLLDDKSSVINPTNQDLDIQRLTTENYSKTRESALEKKSNVDFENLPAYTPPKPEHQSHRTTWSESGIESLPTEWIEKAREDHPSLTKEQALQTFNALDDYYTNERPSERGTDWFKKFKNWVGRDITNNRAKSSPSGFSGQGGANGHAYAQNATERQTESPRPSKHLQQHIAFAGLELYTFNSLLAVDPSVTQKAVRQMATDQGLDVIKLMVDLTKQAKADAV